MDYRQTFEFLVCTLLVTEARVLRINMGIRAPEGQGGAQSRTTDPASHPGNTKWSALIWLHKYHSIQKAVCTAVPGTDSWSFCPDSSIP